MIDWCLTSGREQVNRWHCHRCLDWSLDCHQNTMRRWIWSEYLTPTTPNILFIQDMLHVVLFVHRVWHSSWDPRLRRVLRVIEYLNRTSQLLKGTMHHDKLMFFSDHQLCKITINVCEFDSRFEMYWTHLYLIFST
jgi:hypothetical protein